MKNIKPYVAGVAVVCIWSGWITLSRQGVQTQLQPADITLLRYWTALLVIAPRLACYPWGRYKLYQYLIIGLGVGFPYTMLSFYGLRVIPAAHAGVLVNGMLPVLGAVAAWWLFHERIALRRYVAIALIFLANGVMASGSGFALSQSVGIGMLLTAAVCYTLHMTGIRLWSMSWQDVIVIVPVVNVLLFTPLWFVFPSGFALSTYHDMAVQAVYQGMVVNVFALMCATYAIRHLGTLLVALFMSFVPVTTAVMAWMLLGEALTPPELLGIAGCSVGLVLYAWQPRQASILQ